MAISTAASTRVALAAAFKELFPDRRLEQLAMQERDLMKWMVKKDDLEGDGIWIPVRYGMPQGLGSGFAQGQANVTSGKVKKTFIERNRYGAFVAIEDEAVRAARSKKGAFYGIKETEIEDMITAVSQELEIHLWRDGAGTLGVVSSVSTGVVTLTNPEDVANFQVGMAVVALESTSGTTPRTDTVSAVISIDADAGTIAFTDSKADGDTWAVNDRLVRGKLGESVSTAAVSDQDSVVHGIAAWIPATAETSGSFLSMERFDDIQRLQGFRQDYLGSIEESLKKLASKMGRYGARPDSVWLSHDNWHRLELELGARAVRTDGTAATFGLPTIKYSGPKGSLAIYAGTFCPEDVGYLLKRDSWTIHHLDGLPHIVMEDGLKSLRGDGDFTVVRSRFWAENACDAMFHNGRFAIS